MLPWVWVTVCWARRTFPLRLFACQLTHIRTNDLACALSCNLIIDWSVQASFLCIFWWFIIWFSWYFTNTDLSTIAVAVESRLMSHLRKEPCNTSAEACSDRERGPWVHNCVINIQMNRTVCKLIRSSYRALMLLFWLTCCAFWLDHNSQISAHHFRPYNDTEQSTKIEFPAQEHFYPWTNCVMIINNHFFSFFLRVSCTLTLLQFIQNMREWKFHSNFVEKAAHFGLH